jgi:hypothetical protein
VRLNKKSHLGEKKDEESSSKEEKGYEEKVSRPKN